MSGLALRAWWAHAAIIILPFLAWLVRAARCPERGILDIHYEPDYSFAATDSHAAFPAGGQNGYWNREVF